MEYLQLDFLPTVVGQKNIKWLRYVDDVFVTVSHEINK